MKRKNWVRTALIVAVILIVLLIAAKVAFFSFKPWGMVTHMRTFGPEQGWPKAQMLERFGRGGMRLGGMRQGCMHLGGMPFHRGFGMVAPVGLLAFVALIGVVAGGFWLARSFTVVRRPSPPALACPKCEGHVLSEWQNCPHCGEALVNESSKE